MILRVLACSMLACAAGCSRPDPPTLLVDAAPAVAVGGPTIVDLKKSDVPLKAQIAREQQQAGTKTFIVQTTADWCRPCKGLKKSMSDPLMQDALADVRLVRVDVDVFSKADIEGAELSASAIPWFVKLDANQHPVDAITSDEWGEDIAPNMAPVLASFAKGTFKSRKRQWKPGSWM